MVLGKGVPARRRQDPETMDEETNYGGDTETSSNDRVMQELEESYRKSKTTSPSLPDVSKAPADDDEDDALSYFSKLADS